MTWVLEEWKLLKLNSPLQSNIQLDRIEELIFRRLSTVFEQPQPQHVLGCSSELVLLQCGIICISCSYPGCPGYSYPECPGYSHPYPYPRCPYPGHCDFKRPCPKIENPQDQILSCLEFEIYMKKLYEWGGNLSLKYI